jgi:serine/threonine protein phosphatase PrpC
MDHLRTKPAAQSLKWFGRSDRGPIRPNNEDSFLGLQFNAREIQHLGKTGEAPTREMDHVFAVSDGMGGALAGEYASRLTVDKITALLPRSFHQSARGMQAGFEDVLIELYDQIHRALVFVGDSYPECSGMEATLSLCWFTPAWMYFAHIGDSRIYYLSAREGGLKQLSHDDTHVGWLLRNGQINEREARQHPRRSVLQKSLGGGNQFVEPQMGAVAYEAGDIFLLCTDGLVEGIYPDRMLEVLQGDVRQWPNGDPAHQLVEESIEGHTRDNATALVIHVA